MNSTSARFVVVDIAIHALCALILVVLVVGCGGASDAPAAGGSTTAPAPTPAPAPAAPSSAPIAQTAAGIPEGLPTEATIGAGGGILASSDGRLSITVPAGALSSDTVIAIQPITATAPGALGPAYRLTPEGHAFALPVTLTFTYSAAEAGASVPNLLRVATQTAQGTWSLPATTRDAGQRTLSVATTHFSDWSRVGGVLLRPEDAVVRVNKELALRVIVCDEAPANAGAVPLSLECITVSSSGADIGAWSVNGAPGGNTTVGTVRELAGQEGARYKAPAAVPPQTPVAVSARYEHSREGLVTLVAEVTVVDEIRAYGGAFFAKVTTPAAEMEFSANVYFFHIPDPIAEAAGQRIYGAATGSAVVRARLAACGWGQGTAFLDPQLTSLVVTEGGAGPLANTYQLGFAATPTMTFECSSGTVTGPFVATPFVGLTASCQPPAIEDALDGFASSWSCRLAADTITSANWTLRAGR